MWLPVDSDETELMKLSRSIKLQGSGEVKLSADIINLIKIYILRNIQIRC